MPTDVFFCSVSSDENRVRHHMSLLCWERWSAETMANPYWLSPYTILRDMPGYQVSDEDFQRLRRSAADARAAQKFYILADDDCLPDAAFALTDAVRVLEAHPEFAILSLWPVNASIEPWRPADYEPYEDDEVMEHVSVGGIRVCRKMPFKKWPAQTGRGYDREQCEAIRAAGMRVGYFKNLKMLHLGEGYSSVW